MFISDALAELVTEGVRLYGCFHLDVLNGRQFILNLFGRVDCLEPDPMFVGDLDHLMEVTLGARGQLPSGSMLSTWWVLKQFAQLLPSG